MALAVIFFLPITLIAISIQFEVVPDYMEISVGDRGNHMLKRTIAEGNHRMAVNTYGIMHVCVPIPLIHSHRTVGWYVPDNSIFFDKRLKHPIDGRKPDWFFPLLQ